VLCSRIDKECKYKGDEKGVAKTAGQRSFTLLAGDPDQVSMGYDITYNGQDQHYPETDSKRSASPH
jgi:hypothetical protein